MNNRATGVLVVHSAPRAICSHIEWAMNALIGEPLKYRWNVQPLNPETRRVEVFWDGPVGTGASIASSLTGWTDIRFEVTEDPSVGCTGTRFSFTPELGLYSAAIDAAGSTVLTEAKIGALLSDYGRDVVTMRNAFTVALGEPWDNALEPYRAATFDSNIRLLRGVV